MNCIKAQSMITPFIQNKLSLKETEEFIEHVGSCKNCREELEVYYALLTAMKQLDEDKNISSDFSMELSHKLEEAQEKILHAKFTYYRKKVILFLTIFLLAIYISIRYSYKSMDEVIHPSKSTFQIRRAFWDIKDSNANTLLKNYLKQQEIKKDLDHLDSSTLPQGKKPY